MEGGAELGLDAAEVDGEAQAEAEADAEAQAEAEAEAEAAAEEGAEEGADAEVRSAPPRATFTPPQQQHTAQIPQRTRYISTAQRTEHSKSAHVSVLSIA